MTQTVQAVIDAIVARVPGAPFADTVDTLKIGDPHQAVTGMAVTFLTTQSVIEQAIEQRANFIITHEPTFYNHRDETQWLEHDAVYNAKRRLLEDHHIAVWRFHDYLHSLQPDPTAIGMLQALNWMEYATPNHPNLCRLPPRPLHALVAELKQKLGLATLRVVGDLDMPCTGVVNVVGAPGGEFQMRVLGQPEVDVVICGEINEWETNEYVRDALRSGQRKALVVIGHAASEEPGMRAVIPWLQDCLPEMPITFIPTGQPFQWV